MPVQSLKKTLANNFKAALDVLDVTLSDLGRMTGWHSNLWSSRANGVTDIKLEDIVIAANGMEMSPAQLATMVLDPPAVDDRYTLILKELERINEKLVVNQDRKIEAAGSAPRLQLDSSTAS